MILDNMDDNEQNQSTTTVDKLSLDRYQADLQAMVDSYATSVDSLALIRSPSIKQRRIISSLKYQRHMKSNSSSSSSELVTFDRDPAATRTTEHLTDELRWRLIQYGPYQPRDDGNGFSASAISLNNGRGTARFRSKWFDDPRFSDWLEYSLISGRAYCFYCRLFVETNRNRAFSCDGIYKNYFINKSPLILGIRNWRKCLGSRGQKKQRSTRTSIRPDETLVGSQKPGLLESHSLSGAHKQAYNKYLTFIDQIHLTT